MAYQLGTGTGLRPGWRRTELMIGSTAAGSDPREDGGGRKCYFTTSDHKDC